MLDFDACHRGLVRKQGDLVSQHLGFPSLDEQWRQAFEVAKEGRDVRVCQVFADRLAEKALDGVQVVVLGVGIWQIVVGLRRSCVISARNLTVSRASPLRTRFVSQLSQDLSQRAWPRQHVISCAGRDRRLTL